jgi:tetratricopeptide (TPR) repeat protein
MSRRRKVSTKRSASAPEPLRWMAPVGLALILLLTLVIYTPSLNGTRLWDDDGHITRPELQSVNGLYRIWTELTATQQYYPLLHSAFWLEHKLWGDSVLGYHLVNLFWHMCAVSLFYLVLTRLKIPGALFAAAIFAVHPVMVESVAWISEQKNTLSAVFYLSAMLVYLGFDDSRLRSRYFLALGLFVLGLLTKTVTATLPAALLVIFWWQRGKLSWKRDVWPLMPFFVLGALSGTFTAWIERTLIGAEGAGFEMTFVERFLLAGRVIWFYLGKLFWPANLMFVYPRWKIDASEAWQWSFSIGVLGVTVGLLLSRKRWRGPLAGWLLFVGTLFPVLGFLNVFPFIFSFVADHFQYLASLGMITVVAAGTAQGISRLKTAGRIAASCFCVIVVVTLAMLSVRQSKMYSDVFMLYRTTLARNSECWLAYNNLGELLAKTNREEGMTYYQAALRIRPEYPEALNNVGYELTQSGRYQEAIEYLEHAVRANPRFSKSRNNLGIALFYLGRVPEATEQFRLAVEINPKDAEAQSSYGNVLSRAGEIDDAIAHYKEAVRLRPSFVEIHRRLGELLGQRGQLQEAIEHYQAALQHQPDFVDIYTDLAAAFASTSQSQEAIATAQKGIEIAHATHQDAAAEQLEEWLRNDQTELQRAGAALPNQPLPTKP